MVAAIWASRQATVSLRRTGAGRVTLPLQPTSDGRARDAGAIDFDPAARGRAATLGEHKELRGAGVHPGGSGSP